MFVALNIAAFEYWVTCEPSTMVHAFVGLRVAIRLVFVNHCCNNNATVSSILEPGSSEILIRNLNTLKVPLVL